MCEDPDNPGRRALFRQAAGTAAAAGVLSGGAATEAQAQGNPAAGPAPGTGSAQAVFFSGEEYACVAAIVDTFLPKDEVGPGGVELGVVDFIDRQLAGAHGAAARRYMQGPFASGTAEQGSQLALTPADFYRIGLADLDAHCRATRGGQRFADLAPAARNEVLHAIRDGKLALPGVPARAFLSQLFNDSVEGYFSDPIYGGNRGKGSWKMMGFPGPFRVYSDEIGKNRDRKFVAEPRSIADLT